MLSMIYVSCVPFMAFSFLKLYFLLINWLFRGIRSVCLHLFLIGSCCIFLPVGGSLFLEMGQAIVQRDRYFPSMAFSTTKVIFFRVLNGYDRGSIFRRLKGIPFYGEFQLEFYPFLGTKMTNVIFFGLLSFQLCSN